MSSCEGTVYNAKASATASYTGKNGETIFGTATATASSLKSEEDAFNIAKEIATDIAYQNARNTANIIDESVSIIKSEIPKGDTGPQGEQGPQGPQGPQGIPGADGSSTNTGATGPLGPQGPQGIQGFTGPQGIEGQRGLQGVQGVQGELGTQGIQGQRGLQGLQGVQGNQGVQGIQGPVNPTASGIFYLSSNIFPPTPSPGQIFFNDTTGLLYIYSSHNNSWGVITPKY